MDRLAGQSLLLSCLFKIERLSLHTYSLSTGASSRHGLACGQCFSMQNHLHPQPAPYNLGTIS